MTLPAPEFPAPEFPETTAQHWCVLGICAAVLFLSLGLQVRETHQVESSIGSFAVPDLCLTRRLFHGECPGCGLTRAMICMVRGDVVQAFHFNPAGPLMFMLIATQVPYRWVAIQRQRLGKPPLHIPGSYHLVGVALAVMILQWVIGWFL